MTPFYIELDLEWHIIHIVNGQGWKTYCGQVVNGKASVSTRLGTLDRLCAECRENYETAEAERAIEPTD
jgi:hypothetical protein